MDTEHFNPEVSTTSLADLNSLEEHSIQEELCKFEKDFLELQNPRSSTGRLMYVFVRRSLQVFRLSANYREAFVLNEAYIRATKLINEGGAIHNVQAWVRSTTYNIIRELSRERQKSEPLEEHIIATVEQPSVLLEELEDDLETVRIAFGCLDPKDQRLLNLKIVEGLSWREIREVLRLEGWRDLTEEALRKRKERALIRLRKKFHALKPPEFSL
jgi:DNA-directed RNA polymerase specialized sigma24 family protein